MRAVLGAGAPERRVSPSHAVDEPADALEEPPGDGLLHRARASSAPRAARPRVARRSSSSRRARAASRSAHVDRRLALGEHLEPVVEQARLAGQLGQRRRCPRRRRGTAAQAGRPRASRPRHRSIRTAVPRRRARRSSASMREPVTARWANSASLRKRLRSSVGELLLRELARRGTGSRSRGRPSTPAARAWTISSTAGREHARDLGQHLLLLGDVLDHLERHDGVERVVRERRTARSPRPTRNSRFGRLVVGAGCARPRARRCRRR